MSTSKRVATDVRVHYLPGHGSILQSSVILEAPVQFKPPKFASILGDRLFVLDPPPHDFEQAPTSHSSHSQSTFKTSKSSKVIDDKIHFRVIRL